MTMRRSALLAVLLLAACEPQGEPADPARAADSARAAQPAASVPPTPADSAVAAEAAKEFARPPARDTGYTAWQALQMPSEPWEQSAATADALLRQVRDVVAAQMEEPDASVLPTRMQSQAADSAVGLLTHPDLADDSIRDVEFRLHMRRDGSVWRVTAVDRRERCRRGVAEGGRCA